jgi:hypothetical protein
MSMPLRGRIHSRLRFAVAVAAPLALAAAGLGCSSREQTAAPRPCCDQPPIPAGVPPFKVVADEVAGPSDGQKVVLRAALAQPAKRDALFPVLHTLYRHVMKRGAFEPISFTGEVYGSEADAASGSAEKALARITKGQSDIAPRCDNRVTYEFAEQVDRAFAASIGRGVEEDLDDSCRLAQKKPPPRPDDGFRLRPTYKVDPARSAVAVAYPYVEMGKDEYVKELKLNSALSYWTEFTTSLFRKVEGLKEVAYVGIWKDEPVLKITVDRGRFESDFASLQEEISAHAAVTFQSLGMGRTNDQGALKDQEAFKTKTYRSALARLPKANVTISPKLK